MIVTYKGQTYRVRGEAELASLLLALFTLENLAGLNGEVRG